MTALGYYQPAAGPCTCHLLAAFNSPSSPEPMGHHFIISPSPLLISYQSALLSWIHLIIYSFSTFKILQRVITQPCGLVLLRIHGLRSQVSLQCYLAILRFYIWLWHPLLTEPLLNLLHSTAFLADYLNSYFTLWILSCHTFFSFPFLYPLISSFL